MILGSNKYETFFNATSKEEAEIALQSLIKDEVMNMNIVNQSCNIAMSSESKKFYEGLKIN